MQTPAQFPVFGHGIYEKQYAFPIYMYFNFVLYLASLMNMGKWHISLNSLVQNVPSLKDSGLQNHGQLPH